VGFILVGVLSLVPGDQTDIALLGLGIILLLLNLARYISNITVSYFTITLGVLALILGTLVMLRPVLGLHFEVPLLPVCLIVIGLYLLIPEPRRVAQA
jgi:hypothetical protein